MSIKVNVLSTTIAICLVALSFMCGMATEATVSRANPQAKEFATYDTLDSWSILQMAIIKTESDFNPLAVGKTNDVGIYQITPVYVNDVNRILGKDEYMHEDAFSPSRSLDMFNIYQSNYNPDKDILRAIHLHNPGGESIGYTKRVLKNIEYIEQYERIRALVLEHK